MEEFTKGGWMFDRSINRVVDAEGQTICAAGDSWNSYRNSEANAALIAAAPEMYAKLNEISDGLLEAGGFGNCELAKEIESLLSKARGE